VAFRGYCNLIVCRKRSMETGNPYCALYQDSLFSSVPTWTVTLRIKPPGRSLITLLAGGQETALWMTSFGMNAWWTWLPQLGH